MTGRVGGPGNRELPLRFALVGTGLVAEFHARALHALRERGQAELAATTDLDHKRSASFAREHGCETEESVAAVLARGDIDVVSILTPNATHAELGVQVAAAGKHCLVEKPPDMTLEKVDRLIAAFEQSGTTLGLCLNCRFRPALAPIRQAMVQGRFGRLLRGDVFLKWYRDEDYYQASSWRHSREHGAGVTVQQAFHYYDLLLHLMGPVKRVRARMENLAHPGLAVEDTTTARFEYASGACGTMIASTAMYPGSNLRLEINGSDGTAILEGERLTRFEFRDTRPEDREALEVGLRQGPTGAGGAAAIQYDEHQYLIDDLCQAIREGRRPRITAEEGRKTLELALAMYDSAERGAWVELAT